MKDVNKVILMGRLGTDPVQRQTKNGIPVTHLSLATSRRIHRDEVSEGDPAPLAETTWHRIVAWGKLAEICTKYLKKGNALYVDGSIRTHSYEDKDKITRYSMEIHAENVSFLNGPRQEIPDPINPS